MEHVLESPGKRIFESWKTLEFGLFASPAKKHFNVCTNPVECQLLNCVVLNSGIFDAVVNTDAAAVVYLSFFFSFVFVPWHIYCCCC